MIPLLSDFIVNLKCIITFKKLFGMGFFLVVCLLPLNEVAHVCLLPTYC